MVQIEYRDSGAKAKENVRAFHANILKSSRLLLKGSHFMMGIKINDENRRHTGSFDNGTADDTYRIS